MVTNEPEPFVIPGSHVVESAGISKFSVYPIYSTYTYADISKMCSRRADLFKAIEERGTKYTATDRKGYIYSVNNSQNA